MIESYLKTNCAAVSANNTNALSALEGEEIEAILFIQGQEGINYTMVFKSGCSFAFNSRGAYWVNDQKTTRELIEKQINQYKLVHDQYHALHRMLGIAL